MPDRACDVGSGECKMQKGEKDAVVRTHEGTSREKYSFCKP